jgi:hypothetical protein
MRVVLLSAAAVLILTGVASHRATAAEAIQASPELRLSLHDAIQVAFPDPGELLLRLQSLWAFFQLEDRELRHWILSGLLAGCGKTMWAP